MESSVAHRCVALLRGINVGKAKRIAMAELRALIEKLGYQDVKTLLNSGNVVFTIPGSTRGDVTQKLEKAIADKLGVESRVTVVPGTEWQAIIQGNPFNKVADDHSKYLAGLLREPSDLAKLKHLVKEDWGRDAMALGKRVVYLWCANGILESKMLVAVSRLLKDSITTRNWATMVKLQAMLET